uniref:Response regulator receiver domain-containing protein n=1 Tax=Candidatus Kentrum sp. LPFa TaxID=2126335 RepID=A0A450VR26_9GAMM|nr:MAG: hypothetical protein BECKLPF1236A_GA0070988_1000811 [Candidatus Kentron sp. LPFa]VFK23960.1 MAG: hypothetical protein BECKLPF1236C_GA0070990_1000911 [Candidatus Kentron sp. LPFa]
MKYLIIDDMPEHITPLVSTLREAGHQVTNTRNLSMGWEQFNHEHRAHTPFDLIVLDLALDRKIREFPEEQKVIQDALYSRSVADIPVSGQAMGLRLWRRRKEIQQRYCYITYHQYVWMAQLDGEDPEFEQELSELDVRWLPKLILEKSDLWPDNVAEKFEIAHKIWDDKKWLE